MTAFLQHTNPQLRWYRDVGSDGLAAGIDFGARRHPALDELRDALRARAFGPPRHGDDPALSTSSGRRRCWPALVAPQHPHDAVHASATWATCCGAAGSTTTTRMPGSNFTGEVTAVPLDISRKTRLRRAELSLRRPPARSRRIRVRRVCSSRQSRAPRRRASHRAAGRARRTPAPARRRLAAAC